jgi:hypothetical protein
MGVVYVCSASLKFDKVRNECHPEQYVSSYCYGPPIGKEVATTSNELKDGGEDNSLINITTYPPITHSTLNSSTGDIYTGVNGGLVGNFNLSDAPKSSPTQNTSSDTPPWLSNTIMTTSSGYCNAIAERKLFVLVSVLCLVSG